MTDQDETLATTMVLLHGNPPAGLRWRPGGFEKRSHDARQYCKALQELIIEVIPGIKGQRAGVHRNRVLRILFTRLNRKVLK